MRRGGEGSSVAPATGGRACHSKGLGEQGGGHWRTGQVGLHAEATASVAESPPLVHIHCGTVTATTSVGQGRRRRGGEQEQWQVATQYSSLRRARHAGQLVAAMSLSGLTNPRCKELVVLAYRRCDELVALANLWF